MSNKEPTTAAMLSFSREGNKNKKLAKAQTTTCLPTFQTKMIQPAKMFVILHTRLSGPGPSFVDIARTHLLSRREQKRRITILIQVISMEIKNHHDRDQTRRVMLTYLQ